MSFRDELKLAPLNLPRAALHFAQEIAYPKLNFVLYMTLLDQLTDWAREATAKTRTDQERIDALGEFLFQRFKFKGNVQEYDDPRNSYLNEVLDRRLGIPISLSVIYMTVAQGLGLDARGVGLPGHFIVQIETAEESIYLDPFHQGMRLSVEDCARLVEASTGFQGDFQMEWLEPASPRDVLARMLNNLRTIYIERADWHRALAVLEHLLLVQPDQPEHLLDLGLIHHQHGSLRKAVDYYERFLTQAPEGPGAEEVRQNLQAAAQRLAQLN